MEIADRVTVLRDGQLVASKPVASTSERELSRLMVGRDVNLRTEKSPGVFGAPLLQIDQLRVLDENAVEKLRGVSLEVRAGEILGIAGVDGNGQSELAEAILHLREIASGRVLLEGKDVTRLTVAQHRALGIAYVPADRRNAGSVTSMSVAENAILGMQRNFSRGLFQNVRAARESARQLVGRFGIRAAGIDTAAGTLSGGNLQKLILGRELTSNPRVLVAEQPTRGLDVGAVEAVWKELLRVRQEGKAILLISSELEELVNLADRIAVMFDGRVMGILDTPRASIERIGQMMAGIPSEASPVTALQENARGEIH
jgi:general nucleoside transport system ATP-binding protein